MAREDTTLRSKVVPAALLIISVVGLGLVVLALSPSRPRPLVPTSLASAIPASPPAPLPTAVSIASQVADFTPMASPTPPPTSTSTLTPLPTPAPAWTPTPPPVPVSAPLVSSMGQLAYVQDGELIVVKADGSRVWVAQEPVAHDAHLVKWSPDGRWLLYPTVTETASLYVWDSQMETTTDVSQVAGGLIVGPQVYVDVAWSPRGSRLLFRGSPDEFPGVFVLDVETRQAWQVSDRAAILAYWLDEETVFLGARGEGPSEHLSVVDIGPPARAFTETLSISGGILDVPHSLSPDRRYLARLDASDPDRPRLEVASLRGDPSPVAYTLPLGKDWPANSERGTLLWSPDGRWVACSAEANASLEGQGGYTQLFDITRLSEPDRAETPGEGALIIDGFSPSAWSPDSRLLAGPSCSESGCSLSVVDVLSDRVTTLASGGTFLLWDVAWSPGGVYLAYSFTGPEGATTGLTLWDRGTGDYIPLMPMSGGTHPITDLQWTSDGCRLYVARREEGTQSAPSAEAIWGLGPAWEDLWQVAPGSAVGSGALLESGGASGDEGPRPCPAPLLAGRRLIAYYGTPLGPGLGVLGRSDIDTTLRLLNEQAQVYRDLDPDVETIPVFHMVTTVADDHPGDDGDYNHRVQHDLIRQWIDGVQAVRGWSVLDLQPGRAHLDTEWDLIEPLLLESTVHLAVDPEFIVSDAEVPGHDLGRISGTQVNLVQAKLDRLARAIGHRKLLIIHQFDNRMIEQKAMILDYPFVELVWDADGFGGPGAKIADYNQYRDEAGFEHGGFKLFYNEDTPLMTPEQVLALEPPPSLVIYQ